MTEKPKLTYEQAKKTMTHYEWSLKNEKILWFAKSLSVPWKHIYAGEQENPDFEEIKSHPGEWLAKNWLHPRVIKPFAHIQQRRFLYPWEHPELFERWKSASNFCWFAGNRGGKSVAGENFASMLAIGKHPLQDKGLKKKPPLHGWIISPNLPSESEVPRGEDAPILKKFYEWLPDMETGAPWGIRKFYRKDKIMSIMDMEKNESVFNFKSLDQDINKFKSEDIDVALLDEDPKSRPIFNEVTMRLIDYGTYSRLRFCF